MTANRSWEALALGIAIEVIGWMTGALILPPPTALIPRLLEEETLRRLADSVLSASADRHHHGIMIAMMLESTQDVYAGKGARL